MEEAVQNYSQSLAQIVVPDPDLVAGDDVLQTVERFLAKQEEVAEIADVTHAYAGVHHTILQELDGNCVKMEKLLTLVDDLEEFVNHVEEQVDGLENRLRSVENDVNPSSINKLLGRFKKHPSERVEEPQARISIGIEKLVTILKRIAELDGGSALTTHSHVTSQSSSGMSSGSEDKDAQPPVKLVENLVERLPKFTIEDSEPT